MTKVEAEVLLRLETLWALTKKAGIMASRGKFKDTSF